jgi:hypothetical protein
MVLNASLIQRSFLLILEVVSNVWKSDSGLKDIIGKKCVSNRKYSPLDVGRMNAVERIKGKREELVREQILVKVDRTLLVLKRNRRELTQEEALSNRPACL